MKYKILLIRGFKDKTLILHNFKSSENEIQNFINQRI